jgi:hypothetical protein
MVSVGVGVLTSIGVCVGCVGVPAGVDAGVVGVTSGGLVV